MKKSYFGIRLPKKPKKEEKVIENDSKEIPYSPPLDNKLDDNNNIIIDI